MYFTLVIVLVAPWRHIFLRFNALLMAFVKFLLIQGHIRRQSCVVCCNGIYLTVF